MIASSVQRYFFPAQSSVGSGFLRIVLAALVAVIGCPGGQRTARAQSAASTRPVECTPKLVKGLPIGPAPARWQLRVLVARFTSEDESLRAEGADVARRVRLDLDSHIRRSLDLKSSGLLTADLRVHEVPCLITTHDHARRIGRAASAQVIFWGHVYGGAHTKGPTQQIHVSVGKNSSPVVTNSSRVKIVNKPNINVLPPAPADTFQTSMTVVRWQGLYADDERETPVHGKARPLSQGSEEMETRNVKSLFDCVLGVFALRVDRHKLAVEFLDACLHAAAGTPGLPTLYRMAGQSLVIAGQPEKGMEILQEAHRLCQRSGAKCQDETLYRLGWAKEHHNQTSGAHEDYQAALDAARQYKRLWFEGAAQNGIGRLHARQGRLQDAQEWCERGRRTCKKSGAHECVAEALRCLAQISVAQGNLPLGEQQYIQALQLSQREQRINGEARATVGLGQFFAQQGRGKQAQDLYEKALLLFEQAGDEQGLATATDGLVRLAESRGEQQKTMDFFKKALSRAESAKDKRVMATLRTSLQKLSASLDASPENP